MPAMTFPVRKTFPFGGFVLPCVAALAACTASSPQPQPPGATSSPAGEGAPSDTAAAGTGTAAATAAAGTGTAAAQTPPGSTITNEPPAGGTVMANGTAAPAGSDRMDAMFALVKANKDGFRKCFDLWGKKNPGQAGKIAFEFHLKVDGALEKAQMKRDEGDVHAAEVENCMIDFAKTLTYPKSGVGKNTIYTHRFEFKAAK
jgi:hypothetical protein